MFHVVAVLYIRRSDSASNDTPVGLVYVDSPANLVDPS